MTDVKEYCDQAYKRMIGLKAGLYDVIAKAEKMPDPSHTEAAKELMAMVDNIDAGIEELQNQCPADWSPNKKKIEENMARLSETLNKTADRLGVTVPDTTAWL